MPSSASPLVHGATTAGAANVPMALEG
ncbi:MAG: hypothetical protein RIS39_780, partial [Actinomycetota bacterium]